MVHALGRPRCVTTRRSGGTGSGEWVRFWPASKRGFVPAAGSGVPSRGSDCLSGPSAWLFRCRLSMRPLSARAHGPPATSLVCSSVFARSCLLPGSIPGAPADAAVAGIGLGQVPESTPAVEFRTLNGLVGGKNPVARQASPMCVNTEDLATSSGILIFGTAGRGEESGESWRSPDSTLWSKGSPRPSTRTGWTARLAGCARLSQYCR